VQRVIGNGYCNSSLTEPLHMYILTYGVAKRHVVINVSTGNLIMHTEDRNHRKLHRVGVLLVHGLYGSLRDMEELNVLLSSRGTLVRDRLPIDWLGWSNMVCKELQRLKQWCKYVFLIGHSLGGSLCLHVAVSEPVAGVVTMCAPVYLYPWMFPAIGLVKHFTPVSPLLCEDLPSYEVRRRLTPDVYSGNLLASVESTSHYLPSLRTELPFVSVPALIMTAIHDEVVPARDGQAIYRLIGSQEKYLVKFRRSSHMLLKGHDREEVFVRTLDFVQNHVRGR
jgi:carboxylesterase